MLGESMKKIFFPRRTPTPRSNFNRKCSVEETFGSFIDYKCYERDDMTLRAVILICSDCTVISGRFKKESHQCCGSPH